MQDHRYAWKVTFFSVNRTRAPAVTAVAVTAAALTALETASTDLRA